MPALRETAERLGVHTRTVKAGAARGCWSLLVAHKANDKNESLFEPPDSDDNRLIKHMVVRLYRRVSGQPQGCAV